MKCRKLFIPVKDQSTAHTTVVLWICFVQKVRIMPFLKTQGVKIEISDIRKRLIGYCSFEIGYFQS